MAFTPGSNTLLYVPLKTDFNDVTQHGTVGTNTGELKSIGGVTAGYYESVNETEITSSTNIGTSSTMLAWVYNNGNGCIYGTDGGRHGFGVHTHNLYFYNGTEYKSTGIVFQDSWYLIAIAQDTNSVLFYANCNEDRIKINEVVSISNSLNPSLGGRIGGQNPWGGVSDQYISNLIIENRKWTIEEIEAYFNSTKADYGYEPDPVPGLKKAGIYHNPTLGLITMSSGDGYWTTIADKNLGATKVYNDGDSLSEANCGKYYQWGNNYGFPWAGDITKSTTKVNASNYGPDNYYSSNIFIYTASSEPASTRYRDTSNNQNLWGDTTNTNIARRGPCGINYHVPSRSDFTNVFNICSDLGIDKTLIYKYIKTPFGGYRSPFSGDNSSQGTHGFYHLSSPAEDVMAYRVYLREDIAEVGSYYKTFGNMVRPFANTPVEPDDTWITLYEKKKTRIIKKFYHMGVEYKIKGGKPTPSTYTPGIYHNASLGLISLSSDGSEWITIADKNLGATTVWNYGDSLTDNNSGNYYQWGNNYGFSYSGTVTTSSTRVNASSYGPGNYYSSATFITTEGNTSWDSSGNSNLWGYETGTKDAMRGPCSVGFHIPTEDENTQIDNIGTSLGAWSNTQGKGFKEILKVPHTGYIYYDGRKLNAGNDACLWSSGSLYNGWRLRCWQVRDTSPCSPLYLFQTSYGIPIRPIKNEAVVPDSSWTVLYQ